MESDPKLLEKAAHDLLAEQSFSEAYKLFRRSGDIYKQKGNHKEAALCLASAASCWDLRSGEKTFHNSSLAYEDAARQAEKAQDLEYASLLYRHAARSYERDMEFLNFSECFYRSKECCRKFLTISLFLPGKIHRITADNRKSTGLGSVITNLFLWVSLSFSSLIWGHGERPARTLYSGLALIFLSTFFYANGQLMKEAEIFKPDFLKAFYFSVVTFTTVGYGDLIPVGVNKIVAMIEAFCGIFIMPLFVIGLSRKYLRV
jgi:hypothetical protein